MKLFTTIALFLNLTAFSQTNFIETAFASDSIVDVFKSKLNECFNNRDFDFTDFVIDNKYFLVAKVLTLGPPKLYVSTFDQTVIVEKSKLFKNE